MHEFLIVMKFFNVLVLKVVDEPYDEGFLVFQTQVV
jgi:hypothetical protein